METVRTGGRPYTFDVMEMLELRAQGWTFAALGRKYGKDHTTIIHSCKKFSVVPNQPVRNERIKKGLPGSFQMEEKSVLKKKKRIQDKYAYIFDEPVNPGKTYEQYLAEAKKRPIEKHYLETWGSDTGWTGMYAGGKKGDGPSLRDLKSLEEEI